MSGYEQRALPGETTFTLVTFNHHTTYRYDSVPLNTVPDLQRSQYRPQAGTALLDAMGRTISRLGDRLSIMPEDQRPSSVVVATLTDGFENHSRHFTAAQIAALVRQQTEVYSWTFLFLAANQDAVLAAARVGIHADFSLSVSLKTPDDCAVSFRSLSRSVRRSRSAPAAGAPAGDRCAAEAGETHNAGQARNAACPPSVPAPETTPEAAQTP